MDKKDVREWFECYAVDMGGSWSSRDDQLELACQAIAQAHEQELAAATETEKRLAALEKKLLGVKHKQELAQRQAQVAMMAEALKGIKGYASGSTHALSSAVLLADMKHIVRRCDAALQSAPPVLYCDRAKTHLRANLRTVMLPMICGATDGSRMEVVHAHSEPRHEKWEGDDVQLIIVLEGPNALQEQSKAQGPTCQPKGEHLEKSEQGYKRARGIIPWKEGDELPEDTIARLRGRESEHEE